MAKKKKGKTLPPDETSTGTTVGTVKQDALSLESELVSLRSAEPARRLKKRKRRLVREASAQEGAGASELQAEKGEKPSVTEPKRKKRKLRKRLPGDDGLSIEPKLPSVAGQCSAKVNGHDAEAYRRQHEIVVKKSCPEPLQTFDAAEPHLTKALTRLLRAQGFDEPMPIQAQSWPIALQGDDMVGVAKTGSGKTVAFILPILARLAKWSRPTEGSHSTKTARPRALVLAPTRELAQQIASETNKFTSKTQNRVVCVFGGVPKNEQVAELRSGAEIVIATPGRLLDLVKGPADREPAVTVEAVAYLVLDEADRMLDMGFEPDIRKIIDGCQRSGTREEAVLGFSRQTLFFTATWPVAVRRVAASFTNGNAVHVRIAQGALGNELTANSNVKQTVMVVQEREKIYKLKDIIATEMKGNECAIVFAMRKDTCDELQNYILGSRVPSKSGQEVPLVGWCRAIHGNKEQYEREISLQAFRAMASPDAKQLGRKAVLIATDVASRGLDIKGVALVIIYDFGGEADRPGVESYVHRIGRTGRAGKIGRSVTFLTSEDTGAPALVELLRGGDQEVSADLEALAEEEATRVANNPKKKGGKGKGGRKGGKKGKSGKGGKGKDGKGGKGGKGKGKGKGEKGVKRYD